MNSLQKNNYHYKNTSTSLVNKNINTLRKYNFLSDYQTFNILIIPNVGRVWGNKYFHAFLVGMGIVVAFCEAINSTYEYFKFSDLLTKQF